MKRSLRDIAIIFVVSLIFLTLASSNIIPEGWKLEVAFVGGLCAGAWIYALDERILLKKIEMLKKLKDEDENEN